MKRIDEATIRRLAVESSTDPRTIRKVILGKPVRGMSGERAREALVRAGFPVVDPAMDVEHRP